MKKIRFFGGFRLRYFETKIHQDKIQEKSFWQYYTLLEQKAIILIFISIIDINVNLSKNEIDKKINLS